MTAITRLIENPQNPSHQRKAVAMDFPALDFSSFNETDVREEVVAPLIRHLGYRTGTEHNVRREQSLSYDKLSLGRKKPTDPTLRGRADYICEAGGRVRWVIEAKGPDEPLDSNTAEQSWSYANHPEIRAVYFCLTNGREFHLYQTSNGPTQPPLFFTAYSELPSRLLLIENFLRPESVLRDFPVIAADVGIPLGPGLRSICRITHGFMTAHAAPGVPPLLNMNGSVSGGTLERVDGALVATLIQPAAIAGMEALQLEIEPGPLIMKSQSAVLSANADQRTSFSGGWKYTVPAGTVIPNMLSGRPIKLPFSLTIQSEIRAEGHLVERSFRGTYFNVLTYSGRGIPQQVTRQSGDFEIHLS